MYTYVAYATNLYLAIIITFVQASEWQTTRNVKKKTSTKPTYGNKYATYSVTHAHPLAGEET